jgi:hypothetical protein
MKLFIILTVFFTFVFSCNKDKTVEPACTQEYSFVQDVNPIILSTCATAGCHNAADAANDMIFESYDAVFQNRVAIQNAIKQQAGVTPMPIGSQLSSLQIQTISCWIDQGAQNN